MWNKMCYAILLLLTLSFSGGGAGAGDATLVGWWPLDGDTLDYSGYGNHGTVVGSPTFVAGIIGTGALDFGGADAIEIPHSDSLSITDAITIAAWTYMRSNASGEMAIVSKGSWAANNLPYELTETNGGVIFWQFYDNEGRDTCSPASPAAGEWHHIAATYDSTIFRCYVDGQLGEEWAYAGAMPQNTSPVTVGRRSGGGTFYNGMIDDVAVFHRALEQDEIAKLMTGIKALELAADPIPEDGAVDVRRDVVLQWTAGKFANTHDVYFGTQLDDVNTAGRANPQGVLVSQGQTATAYDPEGLLDFQTTYYWRVDEVNAPPDSTIFRGPLWSFTTEPFAYPVENVVATTNATSTATESVANIVNGSGLDAADQHSTRSTDMWLGKPANGDPMWVQFEFDRTYKLYELWVWNYNVEFELLLGFGIKNVTVEYSTDAADWASLGDVELVRGTAKSAYAHNTTVDLGGLAARYIRLTVNSGFGVLSQYGLSEVRFMYIPAFAREPEPADGAAGMDVEGTLSWRPGREAVSHNVYLGTDPANLVLAGTVDAASFQPDDLVFGNVYYWQVDEVNAAASPDTWQGDLWSFTTAESATIDDIEAYTDDIDAGQAVFQNWIDGWTNNTGSTTGYTDAPFAEKATVHGGRQSMPVSYDNTSAPFYSEISRTWDGPQDWTGHGANTLVLYFYGAEDNAAETLYVAVEDSAGQVAVVAHPDPEALRVAAWQSWTISYSELAGVNMARVETMYIGVGNRATPTAGGSGLLFIDDIGYGAPLAE